MANKHSGQEFKGRAKEAAGDLTGKRGLKLQGRADQTAAKAKRTAENVVDKVKALFRKR